MDPLAARVATRWVRASLEQEFVHRWEKLYNAPGGPPPEDVAAFRKWIADNFKLSGRVPKEGKMAQEALNGFWRSLERATQRFGLEGVQIREEDQGKSPFRVWFGHQWENLVKRELPNMVEYLTTEGTGKALPVFEKKVGGDTYVNMVGASAERLDAMIATIEGTFGTLKGWHRKALEGGVHVVFVGPKDFRGTASGTYKSATDQLWIRATPGGRIDKGGGGYGGLAYVIVHELGHRYERKHHVPFDFERSEWMTSPYSQKEGEAFAELFALSNFGIKHWHPDVIAKFEHLMETGKMPAQAQPAV
jgi:hypothetical protein